MVRFHPKLLDTLKGYSGSDFRMDLAAGLTVGIVALPLAMAFGIASGVDPKAGIYTAIVAGFLISLLGGSRVQIGGPTGAFVAIVYGIVVQYGLNNLILCTMMAGVALLIMGLARLGTLVKFIPYPVTTGFTSGIAVIIFSTQVKDFLGLKVDQVPADFVEKLRVLAAHLDSLHWPTLALAAGSLATILFWPKKLAQRLPGSIVAMVIGTALVVVLDLDQKLGVETIGTRFHGIPQSLPPLQFPSISYADFQLLFRPALTIALLAAIESLLCAVIADGMVDDRHDSNQELMAQGIANIGSALFGGMPATGAIARTATNVKNGARTPVAGLIHAATLLVIVLVAAPLARHIPLATLSAILVVVAFNMGEWHQFARLPKWPRGDAAVFLCAFILTVVIDLVAAVEIGLVVTAVLYIRRVSEATGVSAVGEFSDPAGSQDSIAGKNVPDGVMVFRVFGAFMVGAADKLETALNRAGQEPQVLILLMRQVMAMDATGLNALEDLHEKMRRHGKHLVLSGPHSQPLFLMHKADFVERIGFDNVCADLDSSLARARQLLESRPK
jgi:SulP family sulfate permease